MAFLLELHSAILRFRVAVDVLVSRDQLNDGLRTRLIGLHTECSRLYWYAVRARTELPLIPAITNHKEGPHIRTDRNVENVLRKSLGAVLSKNEYWREFKGSSALGELAGFKEQSDYVSNLRLHVPEIYAEGLRAQEYISIIRDTAFRDAISELASSLEHLSRNHMIFLLPALEFASSESNWNSQSPDA